MKKIQKILLRLVQILFILLPVVLGTIGFSKENGGDIISAAYTSCRLYGMDADMPDVINGFIQAARWLAPLAAASGILLIIESFGRRFLNWFKKFNSDNIVVYGNSVSSRLLLENLGSRGITPPENKIVNAKKHVILFDTDQENIDFYTKNQDALNDKEVYIHLDEINELSISNAGLHVFSMTEIAARLFWREEPIPFEKVERGPYRIIIIGFEDLGQELLKYGLLSNIFAPDQKLEYHIFGNTHHFFDWHRQLHQMAPDEIIVHDNDWCEEPELLAQADRIIFSGEDRINLTNAGTLLAYYNLKTDIELFAAIHNEEVLKLIGDIDVIKPFAVMSKLCTKDYILKEKLNQEAIRTHELYNSNITNPEWKIEWKDLSAFLRYSNISSADFDAVRKRYIEYYADKISHEKMVDILTELEHIRWCRYHYLNNWVLGDTKDQSKRTHPCLIPFSELSMEEIEKDKVIVEKFIKDNEGIPS